MRRYQDALAFSSVPVSPDMVQLNDAQVPTSKIQVAKTGSFSSKRYGKFSITEEHIDQMIQNHQSIVTKPPVDYHHLSMKAETPEQTLAAGWFTSLEKDGGTLWGNVEWTPKAAGHIRNKELQYVSPVILFDASTDTQEHVGAVLFSAALTNYPFLKGMSPVSLGDLQAQGILLADMSLDEKRVRLSAALDQLWKNSPSFVWLKDVFDDFVVYEKDGKLFRQDYTVDDQWNVSFNGDPKEVAVQYAVLSHQEGNNPMAEAPKITEQPEFVKLQSDLTDLTGKLTQLTADLTTERDENKKLRDQIKQRDATDEVEKLIRAGKAVPAQREKLVELCVKDPAFFASFKETLPEIVKLGKQHGTGANDEELGQNLNGKDPIALFDDEVDKVREKNPKLSISEAASVVAKEQPELYEARRGAFPQVAH